MLEQYRTLIYTNDEERQKSENKYRDEAIKSVNQIDYITATQRYEITANETQMNALYYEGRKLFNLAVKKFGYNLWHGEAWQFKTCKRKCPFGNMCRKILFEIDNKKYCYGQIYSGIPCEVNDELHQKFDNGIYRVIRPDGSSCSGQESLSFHISFYENFILEFGDYGIDKKINGRNIIPLL